MCPGSSMIPWYSGCRAMIDTAFCSRPDSGCPARYFDHASARNRLASSRDGANISARLRLACRAHRLDHPLAQRAALRRRLLRRLHGDGVDRLRIDEPRLVPELAEIEDHTLGA